MRLILAVFLLFFVQLNVLCQVGPVQLLDFDTSKNNTVILTKGSIERLFLHESVANRDVVVVSIAGAFRKGKSFLLNFMLRYLYANYKSVAHPDKVVNVTEALNWLGDPNEPLKGFTWKSGTKRETVGIVFWSDIFLYDAPTGEKIAIYVMDTQGLFDHNSSPTDNIRIFSLSALISSVQMLNIFNMVEESHLEYLQFATEIARFTAVQSNSESKPFQKLMFVIRDWISPEEYNYGIEGGNNFIKMFMRVKDFHTPELKQVRQYLQKTYESITCFLMPYPGKITARNSTFDGRWSAIDEEFVDTMKELFPIILSPANLTAKTVNGVQVKAFELSVYIRQYVDMFKSENMPEAKSIYESTLDNQFQILLSKAVEVYLESVSLYQSNIETKVEIDELHKISKGMSLKYFNDEKKFGKAEDGKVYLEELETKLEKAFEEWKPVTLEFLEKIGKEQKKTDEQVKLATEAEKRNQAAKKDSDQADSKFVELQQQVKQARYDTEEARREAAELRKQFDEAQKQREEYRRKEAETRRYYEEMKAKASQYEQLLFQQKAAAERQMNEKVNAVRKRDGISQFFEGFVKFFTTLGIAVKGLFGYHPQNQAGPDARFQ